MSKKGETKEKANRIETIARRVTGLEKKAVEDAVYEAYERGEFDGPYFAVRSFGNARMANWFSVWCAIACPGFAFHVRERTHFYFSTEHVVVAIPSEPRRTYEEEKVPAATERAVAIRERIVGKTLAEVKDEADRLLDTGDLTSGTIVFRAKLKYGVAVATAWLLNHALNCAEIYAFSNKTGLIGDEYDVSLSIRRVAQPMFSC